MTYFHLGAEAHDMIMERGRPTDDTPHEIYDPRFNPEPAKEYAPGVTLLTRDGFKIGNAIIVKEAKGHTEGKTRLWLIETDFGNRCKMTTSALDELFTLGYIRDYDQWWEDRIEAITKVLRDDY
jgi:hypothetical protein